MEQSKELTKIADLTPESKSVNVIAKVLSVGEPKEIPSKFGPSRKVAEVPIADESGSVVLSLWQDQIGTVSEGETIQIENGYVSLVKGHIRVNVGKYGKITKSEVDVSDPSTGVNVSDKEYEQPERRPYNNRRRSYGGGGRRDDRDRF
ncbi:MAG: single-stranded DNA-binding protein [Thermoplasmata archaeon]|uniref:Single-stranded DNA-binding protein n=1 Tax=Candidatus Sysuiplasma superficiale TaxID=2823368 RepID=A0A8J7YTP7_9ARCH|nr:single-stranded DNA-binding protein [Candidatus Sysuiplasma superficiale]MBX8643283.1 single-stranded DNA-binding protein [Candidatus Sysuiplasma superficiale]